jgi:hypothetical protein
MHEMIRINFRGYEVFPDVEITNRGDFSDRFLHIGMNLKQLFNTACQNNFLYAFGLR